VEFEVPKSIPQAFATLIPLEQKGRIICHAAQIVLRLLKGKKTRSCQSCSIDKFGIAHLSKRNFRFRQALTKEATFP
jgi:hypothetical protein